MPVLQQTLPAVSVVETVKALASYAVEWSLYFKTTHGTKKMWYYIAGGLKIKVT